MTVGNEELVIGLFLPLLVGLLKQEHFAQVTNAVIAIVVYAVAGIVAVFLTKSVIDINNIVPTVVLFVTEGTVAYNLFWKNLEGTNANTSTGTSP